MQSSKQLRAYADSIEQNLRRPETEGKAPFDYSNEELQQWLANCLYQLADITASLEEMQAPMGHVQAYIPMGEVAGRQPVQADPGLPSTAVPSNTVQSPQPLPSGPVMMDGVPVVDVEAMDDAPIDPSAPVLTELAVQERVMPEGFKPKTAAEIIAESAPPPPPPCPECGVRGGHRTNCSVTRSLIPRHGATFGIPEQ
jgi:hypothetical protein